MANTSTPPAYGALESNQPTPMNPGYVPATSGEAPPPAPSYNTAAAGYAPGGAPQPYAAPPYPQPGYPPQGAFPSEPPPMYEPSKCPPGPPTAGPCQPQGYPAGYQAGQAYPVAGQTIIVTQNPGFGAVPAVIQCPYCQATITTGLNYRTGGLTWLASGLICIFGCWAGCCLIPFCMPDLQDVEHVCPNCNKVVGVHHRL